MDKPMKQKPGDVIATISPAWGCAGSARVLWKYRLGVKRLEEMGLKVVAAPNSLKGTSYLADSPKARAEDLMWAFENPEVKAVIVNIGGNDSARLLPYLKPQAVTDNPKIFCGYSDVLSLHLYCYQLGLSTFYGDNLLTSIAEAQGWHPYSRHWFRKVFFEEGEIGEIEPSADWSYSRENHIDPQYQKIYVPNSGYERVQGSGCVRGRLFGGHGMLMEYEESCGIVMRKEYFEDKIFFFEDIPEYCTVKYMGEFFDWLGQNGFLQILKGIVIGKMRMAGSFEPYAARIRELISDKYGLRELPVLYGLNFGHSSPTCILPFDAEAELDVEKLKFRILESGVV